MGENGNFQRAGTRERNIGLELVRVTEAAAYAATLDELTQICPVPLPGEEHADTGRKAEAGQ